MVKEEIVLGHNISAAGLEVDQANISKIKILMAPTTVKGIISFLGHASFYKRFIKNISKIVRPLCRLLEKDTKFNFNNTCKSAFDEIKSRLKISPVMATPDWSKDFEIMCDASDFSMGTILGQRIEKIFRATYYASKCRPSILSLDTFIYLRVVTYTLFFRMAQLWPPFRLNQFSSLVWVRLWINVV